MIWNRLHRLSPLARAHDFQGRPNYPQAPFPQNYRQLMAHFRASSGVWRQAERGRTDHGLWQLIISSRITILEGSFRLAEETGSSPAPKEQPPRKLSGNKDRKAY
jgi:hypothetical protein